MIHKEDASLLWQRLAPLHASLYAETLDGHGVPHTPLPLLVYFCRLG